MQAVRIAAAAGAVALLAASATVSADEKQEYKAPGATKDVLLHQMDLAAGDNLEARVIRFTLPAGYKGGRHYHTGDLIVYVASGSLTSETANGTRTYKAGEAFYEIPGEVMRGVNESTDEETVLLVFQVGQQGEPLMVQSE
jgi:quercetin dioxygenase-like cupin family protein